MPVKVGELSVCLVKLFDFVSFLDLLNVGRLSGLGFFNVVGDSAILDREHATRLDALAGERAYRSNGQGICGVSSRSSSTRTNLNIVRILDAAVGLRLLFFVVHVRVWWYLRGSQSRCDANGRKGRSKEIKRQKRLAI